MRQNYSQLLIHKVKNRTKIIGASTVLTLAGLGGGVPLFLSQSASALANSVYVSPAGSGTVCSSAHPCATITLGLAAVTPGGTVHVAAGTYSEAVAITQSVKIVGAGAGSTFITAPATLPAEGAIVSIDGAGVNGDISNLTVQGPGPSSCGSIMSGVFVEGGANGNLHNMAVNDIHDSPLSGCQNGRAILVGWGHGFAIPNTTGTATIKNVSISGYQKAGIEVSGAGSNATIENNTISGVGPTTLIAANGVEVTFGAAANVTNNTISGNNYTPAGDFAAGILLYQPAAGTVVKSNTVSNNEIGVWTDSQDSLSSMNLNGVSGNGRDAVADTTGWSTPAATYADSSVSGISNADGGTVLKYKGVLRVFGYDIFNAIQGALNGVGTNGTVNVANGTYSENLVVPQTGTQLVGQSKNGVQVNNNGANIYGYGVTVQSVNGVSISNMTFNDAAGQPIGYHFHAYQANNLTLSNLVLNGPGKTAVPQTGGVDINSSSNVAISNVKASNYSKNGFALTAKYAAGDTASANVSLADITANNNAWAGLAFYTMNGSSTVGANITGVTITGNDKLTNNGQGLFVEGDSDAHFGAHATPAFTVTGLAGADLNLGTTRFSGNTADVVNYQTANISALTAKFSGKLGNNMNQTQRNNEEALIVDSGDIPSYGTVIFFNTPINLSPKNNATVTNVQLVDWSNVPGAIGYQYESSLSAAQNPDGSFVSPAYTSGVLSSSQIPTPGTPPGVYHWNVRAVFAGGINGPWTTPWSFKDN